MDYHKTKLEEEDSIDPQESLVEEVEEHYQNLPQNLIENKVDNDDDKGDYVKTQTNKQTLDDDEEEAKAYETKDVVQDGSRQEKETLQPSHFNLMTQTDDKLCDTYIFEIENEIKLRHSIAHKIERSFPRSVYFS